MITVDRVSRDFGKIRAVDNVSFEVDSGEVIGLLGPNGAGKTTTVRILSTILLPSSGSYQIDGILQTKTIAIRRLIGVLPESIGYPLHWTGEEYICYFAKLYGNSGSKAKSLAADLLGDVGLTERKKARIATYSRGMRQRLGVARALVNSPRVLFLDEPTLGLDPAGQRQILELIRSIASQRGSTVLLSTHFLTEVEDVCSRILILNRGHLVADGDVDEIKRKAELPVSIRIRVPQAFQETALQLLSSTDGLSEVRKTLDDSGSLAANFSGSWLASQSDAGLNTAVRSLIEDDIPILSVSLDRGNLSDAFLSLTGGGS